VQANIVAAEQLIESIGGAKLAQQVPVHREYDSADRAGKYLWRDIDVSEVTRFLGSYKGAKHVRRVNTDLLAEYIEKQVDQNQLVNWSVMLAGKEPGAGTLIGDCASGYVTRSVYPPRERDDNLDPDFYRIRRLVSPSDEAWDLTSSEYRAALQLTREDRPGASAPGGPEIRAQRTGGNALLIIYPLEPQKFAEPTGDERAGPYVGFAISFPGIKKDKPVSYRINKIYQDLLDD
jgi:hypothetical protein